MEVDLDRARITLTDWALGAVVIAGSIGVGLALAGVHSAVRIVLILLFLAIAPTAAIARLLTTFDPFARLILACAANVVVISLIALTMLAEGGWSPLALVFAMAAIVAGCFVVQMPLVRHRIFARGASGQPSHPGEGSVFDHLIDGGDIVPSTQFVAVDRRATGTDEAASRTQKVILFVAAVLSVALLSVMKVLTVVKKLLDYVGTERTGT